MRTTLTLDDKIYARVRSMAGASGRRLGEVVSELLRQRLETRVESLSEHGDNFDFITLPKSGITIRSEDVERALNDDDFDSVRGSHETL